MKTKIFGGIIVLAIAAFAAFNVNLNSKSEVSLLTLANVEALAEESGGGGDWVREDMNCKYEIAGEIGAYVEIMGLKIKVGSDGYARYICGSCKTECSRGGLQQCQARYCESII